MVAKRTSHELQTRYAESMSTVLVQLDTILDRHRLHSRHDYDDTLSRWLRTKGRATCDKLR